MAATKLIPLHHKNNDHVLQCLKDRLSYAMNPDKTEGGVLVSFYECDPDTCAQQFYLSRKQYEYKTGREWTGDIIAYQIRQSFRPGEISGEEANRIGYELAMRFTGGRNAFVVATHTDRQHIHNHIIFNAVNLDESGKFNQFHQAGLALGRLSDIICLENGLSVIEKKGWPRENRQGQLSFLIDIGKKMQAGKGTGYIQWAKRFNVKQASKAIVFLQEKGIHNMSELEERAKSASDACGQLNENIRSMEERMSEIAELKRHIVNYSRTKTIYEQYKKSGFSNRFFEENREALVLHNTAKRTFDELGGNKIPKFSELTSEYNDLLEKKRSAHKQYKEAREEMKNYQIAKAVMTDFLQNEPDRTKQKDKMKERQ